MKVPGINQFIALIFVFLSSQFLSYGQEGNYNFEQFGNQSSLLNGNVIASGSDLALSFYNPSRLSFSDRQDFIINVKAYQYNKFEFEDTFEETNKTSKDQFSGIPSIVAGTFRLKFLPEHDFSYSFISRYRSNLNFGFTSGIIDGNSFSNENELQSEFLNLTVNDNVKDEWIGLTWSYKFSEDFGIGISSFFSIYKLNSSSDIVLSGLEENNEVLLSTSRLNYRQNSYGLFFKIGATWNLSNVVLGANISLPYINLAKNASISLQNFSSGFENEDIFTYQSYDNIDNLRRTALGIETGIEYKLGKHKLHGKLQWFSGVNKYNRLTIPDELIIEDIPQSQFNEAYKSILNFGLGAEIWLSNKTRLIGSFSSDFNAHTSSLSILDQFSVDDENVNVFGDFWHFGLGIELSTNWGEFILGTNYSRSSIEHNSQNIDASNSFDNNFNGVLSKITYQRYRIIIGIEIPFFREKINNLKRVID